MTINSSLNPAVLNKEFLKKIEDVVVMCNRCGFCTSYCPTYVATGSEIHSPRGRNQMFRSLLEGKLADVSSAASSIDTCLLCGECTSVCFAEIPTADLMILARNFMRAHRRRQFSVEWFLKSVLRKPARLRAAIRFAFFMKKMRVSWLLKKMGLLQKIAPMAAAADDLVGEVPLSFLLERRSLRPFLQKTWDRKMTNLLELHRDADRLKKKGQTIDSGTARKIKTTPQMPRVAYMPVCGSQFIRPSIGEATFWILKQLGVEVMIPELVCCGLPAASYGVIDQVREIARENITRLEKGGFEAIVVDDSSCAAHLKEYPKYFRDDQDWFGRAMSISQKIRELSSFFVNRGLTDELHKKPWFGGPVCYHDPCKAQYGQKLKNPPRDLLEAIPNLRILPVTDADQCCGGGGAYSFIQPDMSKAVLENKTRNLVQTGAKIVVTSATSCLVQIGSGLRKRDGAVEILHLSEFLRRAMSEQR